MKIYEDIYRQILSSFPTAPPENGGIIGSSEKGIITEFYFDAGKLCYDRAIYTPDISALNCKIEDWQNAGIDFQGVIHSHPVHQNKLSQADIIYIEAVMSCLPTGYTLYFPIVLPYEEIIPFSVCKSREGLIIQRRPLSITERSISMKKERRQEIKLPCGKLCSGNCADGCIYWVPNRRDGNGRQYCSHYDSFYYPYERNGCLSKR